MISPSLTVMLSKFTIAASVSFAVGFAQRSPKTILTTALLLLVLWANYAASKSTAFWINLFILFYYALAFYVPVLIFIYYSKTQSYEKTKKLNHQLRYILPIPWPQGQPDYRQAMKYLDQGEMDAGRKLLQDNASSGSDSGRQAELTLHVLEQDYEWLLSEIKASDLKYSIAFECKIIAYGETGQLDKLLYFCLQNVESLASTSFGTRFPLAMIAAYCANRSLWDFSMKLQALPLTPFKKQYWETLLDYNITENESHYRTALESLPGIDKAIERTLLERRQLNPKIIVQSRFSPEEEHNKILELQTRFSKIQSFLPLMHPIMPIASFVLIGFVFILFIVATFFYSSLPEAETQLGALIHPDTLISSESWRFISSCFLPLDWAELIDVVFFFMFIAFFEGIVGWRRFVPIYLLSGVGSALIVFSLLPGIAPFAPPLLCPVYRHAQWEYSVPYLAWFFKPGQTIKRRL